MASHLHPLAVLDPFLTAYIMVGSSLLLCSQTFGFRYRKMECRRFQVTLVSAQNLENVRKIFRNDVRIQAKVSLGGNTRTEKRTPEDKEGQTNPVWNFTATYTIGKDEVKSQDIKLLIQLYCARTARDTNIGEVSVSLKELFDRFSTLPQGEGTAKVSYPVKKGGADSQGEVSFSYKFGDIFVFVPPSIDWGKLCWLGTKFLFKGGVLCIRLTLLASGNVFDVPIDGVADIALTAYDIFSQIFSSGGDLMVDIPWEEIDLPVGVSCPGADLPMAVDTTSSLQTNVCEGSNVPADSTNDGVQMAMDATSVVQTNPFGGSNVRADSTNLYAESNVSTDTANAGTNLPVDVLHIPSARREAPADVTSCVERNVPADVPFSGADVPMAVDASSCEVSMDATFSTETDVAGDISCLKAVVRVVVTSSDETNAGSDVSFLNADVGVDATFSSKTNLIGDISCLEADAWEDAWKDATFNGEARDDISYLEGDFGVDDTFNGEINVTDDISGLEADAWEDAWEDAWKDATVNGETRDDISYSEGDFGVDDTFSGETNATNDISSLEADAWGDATFKGETTDTISCLEGDVGVDDAFSSKTNLIGDISCLEVDAWEDAWKDATFNGEAREDISYLEGDFGVDDTFNGEINVTDDISGLEADAWEDAWKDATVNGETRDDISYLEGDVEVDDTFSGETNATNDISSLEADAWEDATFKGETTDALSCLEADVGVDDAFGCEINVTNMSSLNAYVEEDATFTDEMMDDISWLEGKVDDTSSGETDATAYVSGLVSSARDLLIFLRAKLHLIIILFLFLFLLMLLVFFLLLNVVGVY